MNSESRYFLTWTRFSSHRQDWHLRYLSNSEERLTFLLRNSFGNDFWENYTRVLNSFFQNEHLLFRAKVVCDNSVSLVQIWSSREKSEEFRAAALRGVDFIGALKFKGLSYEEQSEVINALQAVDRIQHVSRFPHILQIVADQWRNSDMILGDPLKKGRNYLPFPGG